MISPWATVNGEFVKRGRDFDADYFTVDEDTRQCLHEEDRTSQVNFTKAMRTFCAFLAAGRQGKRCALSASHLLTHNFIKSTIPTPSKSASEGPQCSIEFIREVGEASR